MFGHHPFSTHSIGDVAPRATFSSIFNVVLYIKRSKYMNILYLNFENIII